MKPETAPDPRDMTAEIEFGGLEDSCGFLITIAQVYVFEQFHEVLGKYGIRPGSMSALIIIGRNPGIRHGALADALRIKLAHMTKMLKSLESEGLVRRTAPPHDRRIVEVHLTDKGKRYVAENAPRLFEHDSSRPDGLTAAEKKRFIKLLRKFSGL